MESRLKKRSINQTKKQLYISLISIVVIIFLTLNFGPYLIGSLGAVIDYISGKSSSSNPITSKLELEPPALNQLPQATSNDTLDISGTSYYSNGKIELYLNGTYYRSVELKNSQEFKFDALKLTEGENIIKIRIIQGIKNSEFSESYKINFIKDEPKLEIISPQNNSSFSKADQEITVIGKTEPDNTVTINSFIAIVDNEGNFSHRLRLNDGENKIKISATNLAQKSTTVELTVSYSN